MEKGLLDFLVFPFTTVFDILLTVLTFPINWVLALVDEKPIY